MLFNVTVLPLRYTEAISSSAVEVAFEVQYWADTVLIPRINKHNKPNSLFSVFLPLIFLVNLSI